MAEASSRSSSKHDSGAPKKEERVTKDITDTPIRSDAEDLEDTYFKDCPEQLLLPPVGQEEQHPLALDYRRESNLEADRDAMLRKWLVTSSQGDMVAEDEEIDTSIEDDNGCCASRMKVSGSCLCKLFVVMYLLACLLISALYIAIYGPNELYLTPEAPHLLPEPAKVCKLILYVCMYVRVYSICMYYVEVIDLRLISTWRLRNV